MRRVFLTALGAAAIGFSALTTAWSQSTPVVPGASKPNASHLSKAGFSAMARTKKSGIRRGVPIGDMKKDDSWYKQMPDPCQVEG
jgi:hypothetical protein